MSRKNLTSSRSLRRSSGSLGISPRKAASYSWEIEGSDYVRKVTFKALKSGEKLGFGLGGKGQRTEVVFVRDGTQSYWKGLQKGYKVVNVNGNEINDITVKPLISDATSSGKDFTISFLVPNRPDWADKEKDGVRALADDSGIPADDKPLDKKEDIPIEKEVKAIEDEKPIIDNGKDEDTKQDDGEGVFGAAEDTDEEYESIMKLSDELKEKEPEELSQESLEKATKEELEEMQRQKEEEYKKLQDHEARLKELIKKKEKEFKEAVTRQNLEDLKKLRKRRKEVSDRAKRVLDDLERIRRMLELRLSQLAAGIKDLANISAARDAKLRELEEAVKIMEGKLL